ncbi:MAG: hypothetical protein KF826_13290 [Xanthobacteraceae bacterium]|nr:hypothetical protein [Xanthobacteraceae bacterium]MBX3548377.1 hypothetical protein [Xanthobacteraceae bacterium]MCW5674111.1 hypothetical protein [Xanthobacteraceae bacterium]MCW5678078.1 hypothetical protein [Xanthobacteraceae bacterium]
MKIDAPQLKEITPIIAKDGGVCQFNLSNQEGETVSFTLTYRQLSYFFGPIQAAAKEMHKRLSESDQQMAAEMIAAFAEPLNVISVLSGSRNDKPCLWFQTEEGVGIGVAMNPGIPEAVVTLLLAQAASGQAAN